MKNKLLLIIILILIGIGCKQAPVEIEREYLLTLEYVNESPAGGWCSYTAREGQIFFDLTWELEAIEIVAKRGDSVIATIANKHIQGYVLVNIYLDGVLVKSAKTQPNDKRGVTSIEYKIKKEK